MREVMLRDKVINWQFLKLGGSLITDKTKPGTARPEVLARLAGAALATGAVVRYAMRPSRVISLEPSASSSGVMLQLSGAFE